MVTPSNSRTVAIAALALLIVAVLVVAWAETGRAGGTEVRADAGAIAAVDPAVATAADVASGAAANADVDASGERVDVPAPDRAPRGVARIVGRVVDERGTPLPGAAITARVRRFPVSPPRVAATSGPDGTFALEDLATGRAIVDFAAEGRCSIALRAIELGAEATVDLGDVALTGGTEVDGVVRIDGTPTGSIQLLIVRATEDRIRFEGAMAISDRNGAFRARGRLPPGHYRVIAVPALQFAPLAAPGGAQMIAAEFDLFAGQRSHSVRIDLASRQ